MKSNTKETVESIDKLIGELRTKAIELENDVKWQPHMKHIVKELQNNLIELERGFTRQFVRPLEKGWFY